MGGASIAGSNDAFSILLNPAGLSQTKFIDLSVSALPILAQNEAPVAPGGGNNPPVVDNTGLVLAPAFHLAAAFRATDFMTFGLGIYPLASAGGGYEYNNIAGRLTEDTTTIRFFEISPGVAFHTDEVSIGIGYRITVAQLIRLQGNADGSGTPNLDLDLLGADFAGFRMGLQWRPIPELELGIVYRHRVDVDATGDDGALLTRPIRDVTMDLHLPARLGFGAKGNIPLPEDTRLSLAVDVEYGFHSQNDLSRVQGTESAEESCVGSTCFPNNNYNQPLELPSYFMWQDAWTVRVGAEVDFLKMLRVRAGYIWDERVTNPQFASAFGTPATDTHTGSFGVGYYSDAWEINLAYAYRSGSADVPDEIDERCLTCGQAGTYELSMHAIGLDFSYYWD
jgi:long-subunit fatty acid transport protein